MEDQCLTIGRVSSQIPPEQLKNAIVVKTAKLSSQKCVIIVDL